MHACAWEGPRLADGRRTVDPRTLAGDPIAHASERKRRITRRIHLEEIEAIAQEETRLGRPMTPAESAAFVRAFHSQEYGEEIRCLMALGVGEPEAGEE